MNVSDNFWDRRSAETPDVFQLPTIAPQGQDGTPHFNYYDRERLLSFQWDGRVEQHVVVSHGGYGEPVKWTFDFMEMWLRTVATHLGIRRPSIPQGPEAFWAVNSHFQKACDNWISMMEDDES